MTTERVPRKNMTAKIIAVIFAVFLWLYVMNEQNPPLEVTYQPELEAKGLESGLQLQEMPETVRVKLRGPRNIITAIAAKDLKSQVELRGLPEGRHTVKIHVSVPPNVEIVEVAPDRLTVVLESGASRLVPLEGRATGVPAPGAVIGTIVPAVTNVRIEGMKSRVDQVSKVIALVDIAGRNADFLADATLVAVQEDGRTVEGVQVKPNKVATKVSILQGLQMKLVEIKPEVQGTPAKGFVVRTVTVKPEKLEIFGELQRLSGVSFVRTEAIPINGAEATLEKEIPLHLEDGIIAKKNTVQVQVTIERSP